MSPPEEDTVWLTQSQIAELFGTTQPNVSMHISSILESGELEEVSVHKDSLYTAQDGKYNLEIYISNILESGELGAETIHKEYLYMPLAGREYETAYRYPINGKESNCPRFRKKPLFRLDFNRFIGKLATP